MTVGLLWIASDFEDKQVAPRTLGWDFMIGQRALGAGRPRTH
jgi:hypothetical protein